MFSLFNRAISIVRSFVAPAPRPAAPRASPLKMGTNYGMQGSNVQVQGSTRQVQPQATFRPIQGSTYNPQPAYRAPIQGRGATVWSNHQRQNLQVVQQAENQRRAAAALQAQQAEIRRKAEEAAKKEALRKKVQSEFDKTKAEYKAKAEATVAGFKKGQNGDIWSKLTGGFTSEQNSRNFANKQLEILYKEQTARYDKKVNDFHKWQAKYQSKLNKDKFGSQAEYEETLKLAEQESAFIKDLEYTRAASEGLAEGYGKQAELEGTSAVAKVGGWFNKNVVHGIPGQAMGGIWKHTLGTGTKQVPSLVTAPARGMNTLTNLGRKKGDEIVSKDGKISKYSGNAWESSFDQSNLNARVKKTTFDDYAINKFKSFSTNPVKNQIDAFKVGKPQAAKFDNNKFQDWKKKNESTLKKEWEAKEKQSQSAYSGANEWALDPISYLPGGMAVKGFSKVPFFQKVASGVGKSAAGRGFSAVKNSKPVSWLGAEYTPYAKRKSNFIKAEVDDIKRKKPLIAADVDFWQANKHKIKSAEKLKSLEVVGKSLSALDDPTKGAFTRFMAKKDTTTAFQELLRSNGDWSQVTKSGRFSASEKKRIESVVNTYRKESDNRIQLENKFGIATPYRSNYIPQYNKGFSVTTMLDKKKPKGVTDDQWWFTKRQEKQTIQSRRELTKSMAARDYYSKVARQDLPVLSKFRGGYEDIGENIKRIENVNKHVKRNKWEQITRPFSASTNAWKTSVLKLNPAWTANNIPWNATGSILAGGLGAIGESARMLKPKNFKAAMNEVPDSVKADLTGELGARAYTGKNWLKKADSKLNAGYTNIENFSRVAAFRAAKKNGLSDAEALKRVNKYLFDYKVRNIERPLKAVLPFYGWNKGLTKAAVNMPFDRPLAAKGFNQVDTYQQKTFERDFETIVPELKKLGYSDSEIKEIYKQQAQYYKGKMKIAGRYMNTPFNALSEKGLTNLGFNPYAAALGESSLSVDYYGQKIRGKDASLVNRMSTKFPQIELGKQAAASYRIAKGIDKPRKTWIGEAGSEGYGLTKERQGYDSKKSSYDRSLDPRAKLGQNFAAFMGVPRSMEFDKADLLKRKRLEKVSGEYFKLDTKDKPFEESEAARNAIFKKYGVTPDEFYKGVLAKYDTDNTKRIKGMKEEAQKANEKLFDEYGKQPYGTKSAWAVKKLRELNASGYFDDNPFKKSFDWIDPANVAKADKSVMYKEALASGDWSKYRAKFGLSEKQKDYQYASSTGDWSKWRSKYGIKSQKANLYAEAKRSGKWQQYEKVYGRSAKAKARDYAVKTGDWSAYRKNYGVSKTETPHRYEGKFFKSAESMQRYKDGKFWERYAKASKTDRRSLLADNPQYNKRANWTDEQWDVWKVANKAMILNKAKTNVKFRQSYDTFLAKNNAGASKFLTIRNRDPRVSVKWR